MKLGFILGEVGTGLRRNLSMVVSVVLVTFISLTFVGTAALMQMQISQMKGYWYDKVQVAIYLCGEHNEGTNCTAGAVTEDQRGEIDSMLGSSAVKPYVDSFEYESKEQALTHFREQFENSSMSETVTADQLPESFRVSLVDPEKYQIIKELFSSMDGVDVVVDQRELLEKIFSIINIASFVAIGIAGVMILCAVLLVGTTIRLSAYLRRRETGIMRLVGASKSSLQLPFILEGVISALIGALLAGGVLWAAVRFLIDGKLALDYKDTAFISTGEVFLVAPWLILLGVVLAGVSSLVTLRRYLKV